MKNVAPRYTSGSPGVVDEGTAARVAQQERDAYKRALEGVYGNVERSRAEKLGLRGIVYSYHVRGKQVYVTDYLTDEEFQMPLLWWGVSGPNRETAYWHSRTDVDQFLVHPETKRTPFESRQGKRYYYTERCPVDWQRPRLQCSLCMGSGVVTRIADRLRSR